MRGFKDLTKFWRCYAAWTQAIWTDRGSSNSSASAPDVPRGRFADQPAAIRLTPGELHIESHGAEDLAAKLVKLSQAMANDWNGFMRVVEEM